jgi:hypothetical protein
MCLPVPVFQREPERRIRHETRVLPVASALPLPIGRPAVTARREAAKSEALEVVFEVGDSIVHGLLGVDEFVLASRCVEFVEDPCCGVGA